MRLPLAGVPRFIKEALVPHRDLCLSGKAGFEPISWYVAGLPLKCQ